MLKEHADRWITSSASDWVAHAMLNASLGQPAHFQVYLNVALSPMTAAATSDCGCSAVLASTKMSYQLLYVFMSDPIGTTTCMTHVQRPVQ